MRKRRRPRIYYNEKYASDYSVPIVTEQDIKDSVSSENDIRNNCASIYFDGVGETRINDISITIASIAKLMNDDESFDANSITAEQSYEAAERYIEMEKKFYAFCEEKNYTAQNMEELTDLQLAELYEESLKWRGHFSERQDENQ